MSRKAIISDWENVLKVLYRDESLKNIVQWRPGDKGRKDTLYLIAPRDQFKAERDLGDIPHVYFRYIWGAE